MDPWEEYAHGSPNLRLRQRRLIEENLEVHEDVEPEERRRIVNARSLRRILLTDVTDAAVSHAQQADPTMDGVDFEAMALEGIEVVKDLQSGLTENGWRSRNWDFWKHEKDPLKRIIDDDMPYMYKDWLETTASDYLNLPYRARILERVLVDVMIALEVYAYGKEMITKLPYIMRWLPFRSPLHQRHALLGYILIGAAVLIGSFLPSIIGEAAVSWTVGILVGLFLLMLTIDTVLLPFGWRNQKKARRNVRNLMQEMLQTYSELDTNSVVSTQRLREVVSKAADAGVVWPSPLFALLDDNISRVGRL